MVAQSQSVSPLSWVIAASAEKCWSKLTSATASPKRSSSKCWKKSGITGGSNGLRAAGVYRIALQAAVCELAQEGNIVYHGRAGQEFFPGIRHVLNVFLDTPTESRIKHVMARKGLAEEAARKFLEELDTIRARRIKELFKIDWRDPTRYDLVLNTAKTTVETAARMIAEISQQRRIPANCRSLCKP